MAKPNKKNTFDIIFSVNDISLEESYVNKDIETDVTLQDKLRFKFSGETILEAATSMLKIIIYYKFLKEEVLLLDMKVVNSFKLRNLNESQMNKAHQDKKFIKSLVMLSVNHTRGIQSTLIKGTRFDKLYMPLLPDFQLDAKLDPKPPTPAK